MSEMEIVEESISNIVSNIPSSSGLSISVHPLVLLNISDHYTRTKLQNPTAIENGRMYGALLAAQTGRDVDIINTFELPLSFNESTVLDKSFLMYKLEQLKQVFPQLDFMGWYSIGSMPSEVDLQLHEQFLEINESALFLQMNPNMSTQDFPIEVYESIIDITKNRPLFIKSTYKIETGEAECIAVDQISKPSSTSTSDTTSLGNTLIAHLTTQRNAIAMLNSRIQFLYQYLQNIKSGAIPVDHDILRQISSLCKRSTVLEKKAFDEQFTTEYNDVLLVAYLASITKGLNTVNDLIDKFNLVNGNHNLAAGPSLNKPISVGKKGRRIHMSRD
ncbi:COP9 signalosome complex subunit 6-like protein [Cokeromyces recurvatus]|uniref:COP9 signalosome complex subunit 6-like protein n=1 Tax=Cokeromyces recurvatus TaxID=90255 RepID=UPI0022203C50|nr:COP9 signalosome complex subunit 6-like protein [Cokeromyces recurvatus]KAI7898943.1 COP9 signalosome complex subunit 6-like protein [Cokeromyces recurvatus]